MTNRSPELLDYSMTLSSAVLHCLLTLSPPAFCSSNDDIVILEALTAARDYRRCRHYERGPCRLYLRYEYQHFLWSLETMMSERIKHLFWFNKEKILHLMNLLCLNKILLWGWQKSFSEFRLCVVLTQLFFSGQWTVYVNIFEHSQEWLSTVFNDTVLFLMRRYSRVLQWHSQLIYPQMTDMAVKIWAQREAERIWVFMNEMFWDFSHSNDQKGQRQVYSDHKRAHSLNWQAIVTSDDLVFFLTDPYSGSTNDWTMWRISECKNAIQCIMKMSSDFSLLYIYGDLTYFCTYRTMCSFENSQDRHWLDENKKNFNIWLSSVRIAVENAFEQTQKLWTYTVFLKSLWFKW